MYDGIYFREPQQLNGRVVTTNLRTIVNSNVTIVNSNVTIVNRATSKIVTNDSILILAILFSTIYLC
jgi:hypothetical protein